MNPSARGSLEFVPFKDTTVPLQIRDEYGEDTGKVIHALVPGGKAVYLSTTLSSAKSARGAHAVFLKAVRVDHDDSPMPLFGPLHPADVTPASDTDFFRTLERAKEIAGEGGLEVSQWALQWGDMQVCFPVTEEAEKADCIVGSIARDSMKIVPEGYLIVVTGPKRFTAPERPVVAVWAFDTAFRAAVLYAVPPETVDAIQPGIYGVGEVLQVRASRVTVPAKGAVPTVSADGCDLWGVLVPGNWPTQLSDAVMKAGYKTGDEVGACLNRKEGK